MIINTVWLILYESEMTLNIRYPWPFQYHWQFVSCIGYVSCTGYDHFPESLRSCDWIYTIHRFWNNTIISLKIFEHSTEIIRKWKFQKCSWTYMRPSVTSRDLFTNSFQYFKKNDPDIAYGCIKNWPLAGFRANSEIIGKFRKLKKFYGHFVKRQKWRLQTNFWGVGVF